MHRAHVGRRRLLKRAAPFTLLVALAVMLTASTTQAGPKAAQAGPVFSEAVAFDVSLPLSTLAKSPQVGKSAPPQSGFDADRDVSVVPNSVNATAPSARPASVTPQSATTPQAASAMPATGANFEGLSNQDNFNVFGFRVNPPDPVGDVGPNHYVEMINLVFAVYSKTGTLLLGPVDTGALWAGFAIDDCTDPSGDPIVVYDQLADRWLLTQFTTRGDTFYNCVAISQTGDPTGAYYRYAFSTGVNFPDYPKYGVYGDSYIITTREFGPTIEYGIGVYGLERQKMIKGNPNARVVSFFIDGNDPDLLPLVGDGLLPPDMDGSGKPKSPIAALLGTQDDNYCLRCDLRRGQHLGVRRARGTTSVRRPRSRSQISSRSTRSTLTSRAPRHRGTASRSRASWTRISTSTSSRTGNGRHGGSPIGSSRRTRRWSPTSRSRQAPAWPACAGTRSGV